MAATQVRGTTGAWWKFTWNKKGVQQEALDLLFLLHTPAGSPVLRLVRDRARVEVRQMRPIFDEEAETSPRCRASGRRQYQPRPARFSGVVTRDFSVARIMRCISPRSHCHRAGDRHLRGGTGAGRGAGLTRGCQSARAGVLSYPPCPAECFRDRNRRELNHHKPDWRRVTAGIGVST